MHDGDEVMAELTQRFNRAFAAICDAGEAIEVHVGFGEAVRRGTPLVESLAEAYAKAAAAHLCAQIVVRDLLEDVRA